VARDDSKPKDLRPPKPLQSKGPRGATGQVVATGGGLKNPGNSYGEHPHDRRDRLRRITGQ
jgi:hypothetical protein